uniref:28S ribosomal protein S27, mitochondrial n=1 Tax=Strigamia maritima TaxID=126957 RepID=T1IWR6_STRMM
MLLVKLRRTCFVIKYSFVDAFRRSFLSDAFECREAWNRRLESPVINQVKFDNLYAELEIKFNAKKTVSAVDIDVFANKINNDEYLIELEELIHKFRRTPSTIHTFESTSHAVIRAFLDFGSTDNLMRMLDDRVNYGIFPDHFTYNLMMNKFLKAGNYRDAAKTATLLMIQEDYENSLTNILALYSCYMYVEKPEPKPWDPFAESAKDGEDDEDQWIRVKYLPLPYFDDHFDLRKENHLVGKTLVELSNNKVVDELALRHSFELLGLVMFEKFDRVKECVERIINSSDIQVYKKCVDKSLEFASAVTDEDAKKQVEQEITPLLQQLVQSGKLIDDDLKKLLENKVKVQVSSQQTQLIEKMTVTYDKWAGIRENEVKRQIAEHVKQERLTKIKEKLVELDKKEELLFFFENIEKHRLNIPPEEEDKMINEEGKLSAKALLDVPPEIEGKVGRYSSKIIEENEPWWRWKEYKKEKTSVEKSKNRRK